MIDPLLYCIAIAALEGVVFYMLGWLDARDRYVKASIRIDNNLAYLLGLLDMQAMYSGCVKRDGKTGRYLGGRG